MPAGPRRSGIGDWLLGGWAVCCALALTWPGYDLLGNRITPWVAGLPMSLAWVADARLIGYYEPHMNAWDCVAAMLLVREAGGWTNDFLENDGLAKGGEVFASGSGLIDDIKAIGGFEEKLAASAGESLAPG